MKNHYGYYADQLGTYQEKGLLRTLERGVTPSPLPGYLRIEGKDYLNLASNDYLGLAYHQEINAYATEIAGKFGGASVSARVVAGQYDFYTETENKLAHFKGKEAAVIGASGFQVNASVIAALLKPFGRKVTVFFDRLNHASMYFGMVAAGIQPVRYRHNDMQHLEVLLKKYQHDEMHKFIMTETVFSMDGDICPMDRLLQLAKKYHCFTVIDDAHSVGVMGKNGAGLSSYYPEIDVVLGTCSKAFGAFGGYVACSSDMACYLRNFASGLVYSTALPPMIWGRIHKALDIIPSMNKKRKEIMDYSAQLRKICQEKNIDHGTSQSQIIPIVLGTNDHAMHAADNMRHHGFYIKAIRSPTVPVGTARLRLSLTPFVIMCEPYKLLSSL